MGNNPQAEPTVFVIFGAAGDLSWRKLVPALYSLFRDHWLPQQFLIIGEGRLAGEVVMSQNPVEFFGVGLQLREMLAGEVEFIGAGHRIIVGVTEKEVRELFQDSILEFGWA